MAPIILCIVLISLLNMASFCLGTDFEFKRWKLYKKESSDK